MDFDTVAFERGKKYLEDNIHYLPLIEQIKNMYSFMDSFSYLQLGRDTVMTKLSTILSPSGILYSAVQTLHSVLLCCEYGHFTDLTTLVRKYRDDLFFYLYVISVNGSSDLLDGAPPSKHELNIKKWQANSLSNLHISEILKFIATRPETKNAVQKYDMKVNFERIGATLNDYVHGNGVSFYNRHPQSYSEKELKSFVESTIIHLNYITVTFVFLLILCHPISIMSTDYIDYMDCGDTPTENSQYWVAPFVEEFLRTHGHLLGEDCIKYLREATNMDI